MTRFVVDASTVLYLVSAGIDVSAEHELLAPTLLRSQTLSALHEAVQRGDLPADVAREALARVGRMPIRLLGDAVLRRRAWEVADQLGWASTYDAEYVALTLLQADEFVTDGRSHRQSKGGEMGNVVIDMSMSVDGYIAAPNDNPEQGLGDDGMRLHNWAFDDPSVFEQVYGDLTAETGAVIMGRRS